MEKQHGEIWRCWFKFNCISDDSLKGKTQITEGLDISFVASPGVSVEAAE